MKKPVFLLVAILLMMLPATSLAAETTQPVGKSAAATTQTILEFDVGNKIYYVNNVQKTLDVAPFVKEGRTLIPIRFVAEALGGTVDWNQTTKEVAITVKDTNIKLWVGKATADVNGASIPIDSANASVCPVIYNSRTFIPLRFVLEAINSEVTWDPSTRTIGVYYPKAAFVTYDGEMFGISHPDNWVKQLGSINLFISPEANLVTVSYEDLQGQAVSLAEYTDAALKLLKQLMPDMTVLESGASTLAGNPAHKIVYTGTQEGTKMQILQIWTIAGGKAHIVTYAAEPGTYPNYSATAQQMIDSFKIK